MRHGGQKTSRECAPLLWKLLSILRVTRSFARAFLELLACNAAIRYVTAYVAGVGDCATQLPAAAALLMPLLLQANFDISPVQNFVWGECAYALHLFRAQITPVSRRPASRWQRCVHALLNTALITRSAPGAARFHASAGVASSLCPGLEVEQDQAAERRLAGV